MATELERLRAALAGRYHVERELGRGGMATVYLAHDLKHDRAVAVKILKPELAAALGPERFHREITLTARLEHPHILPLLDSGEADGFLYYVMPYVEGESLRDRLNREKQLPVDEALRIAGEVADALGHAHGIGIVHRDIKPANILLAGGHARVADFGIARAITAAGAETLTETGLALGTLVYMSPEQAAGDQVIDARSDIYSLGCVLYEMLAGEPPYTGATAAALLARKSLEAVPSLRVVRDAVPEGVEHAVTKALATVPADRFTTAGHFAEALEQGAVAGAVTPHAARGRRGARVATAVAVAAVLALGWWAITGPGIATPQITSLVVLPFDNLSGDPEQEYFVDGMHDAVIGELARIGALTKVISRTSAMRYRGTEKSIPEIARELDVDAVVEGSVLRAGDRVRITLQLIDGREDRHIWADSYERDLRDVLALQGEVARAVAGEIEVTLTPEAEARLAAERPVDPEAYALYLRGQYFLRRYSAADARRALEYFEQSTQEDPGFAPAYAGLAETYTVLALWGGAPPGDVFPTAKAAAIKALELDDLLPEAHSAAFIISFLFEWDWSTAEQEAQRALELSPTTAALHDGYGYYLENMGRFDEAIAHRQRALELDPFSPAMNQFLALAYLRARQNRLAVDQLQRALELYPNDYRSHYMLSAAYAAMGARQEALDHADKALTLSPWPDDPVLLGSVGWVYAVTGMRSEASRSLSRLRRLATQAYVDPIWSAVVLVGLDDKDGAIESITQAVTQRSPPVVSLMVEPWWDRLRDDPRFQRILERMDFPEG